MDSSTFVLTAVYFFIIGAGVVGVIWILVTLLRSLSNKRRADSSADPNLYVLARLLRDNTTNDLVVEVDGKPYHTAAELPQAAQRRLSFTSGVLVKWLAQPAAEATMLAEQPDQSVSAEALVQTAPDAFLAGQLSDILAEPESPVAQAETVVPAFSDGEPVAAQPAYPVSPFTTAEQEAATPEIEQPVQHYGHAVPAFTPDGENAIPPETEVSPITPEAVSGEPEQAVSPFAPTEAEIAPAEQPDSGSIMEEQPSTQAEQAASPFAPTGAEIASAEPPGSNLEEQPSIQAEQAVSPFDANGEASAEPGPVPNISEWIPAEYSPEATADQTVPSFAPEPAPEVKPVSTQIPDIVRGMMNPAPPPQPVFKSIAMQINDILQGRIAGTAFANRGITVSDAPDHGVLVTVDGKKYSGVKDVPDEDVRALIRSAVLEWEKQGKNNGK